MPKGGARVQSGPPPDPNALKRNTPGDAATWTLLPGEGYDGEVPDWPLAGQLDREAVLWEEMWRKPQAVMWARLGQELELALFCRNFAAAEFPGAPVMLQTVVLRLLDSLGLSTQGMLRHRWRIMPAIEVAAPADQPEVSARPSARSRLTVVTLDGDGE